MKISKIIDELTELQQYIGNKELEACIANDTTAGVNVMYTNDDGSITSTSLEGEKAQAELKATMSDQEALGKLKVKVLDLVFCEVSNDPELVARADVEVTNDGSVITLNGLDLRHNDSTGIYSIVEPELPSGVCINGFTCRAVTSAITARYEQIKHSDEMLEKLATATSIDRKEYAEILPAITAHFDIDNMDVHDCLKKCRLELKAAYAYINYLENAQSQVTKADVVPCSMKQPERPVSFIDHTPVEIKEPTIEHSVYSKIEADKYIDWQENRIKQLEEELKLERDRFEPNELSKTFTEMFETNIKSVVNDSLEKIETTCVTALDKFCQQMDPTAYNHSWVEFPTNVGG